MKRILIIAFMLVAIVTQAQKRIYTEIGGQGIKLGVLNFSNNWRSFTIVDTREVNVGLSAGIEKNGNINLDEASKYIDQLKSYISELSTAYGLSDKDVYFYASSGIARANNFSDVQKLFGSIGYSLGSVTADEEAKYTIAGSVPFEKIDVALIFDQGGSNSKGGYVIKQVINGRTILKAIPITYDMGSKRAEILVRKYMQPISGNDKEDEVQEYIRASKKVFDSIKNPINEAFGNIDGAETRSELYLSGGAAFVVATLVNPEYNLKSQMVPIKYSEIKAFAFDLETKESYNKVKSRTFSDQAIQDNYNKALKVYNRIQLISATKLLLVYLNALSADDKKIYFNRWGLHSMPSMLIGKVERGEIKRW